MTYGKKDRLCGLRRRKPGRKGAKRGPYVQLRLPGLRALRERLPAQRNFHWKVGRGGGGPGKMRRLRCLYQDLSPGAHSPSARRLSHFGPVRRKRQSEREAVPGRLRGLRPVRTPVSDRGDCPARRPSDDGLWQMPVLRIVRREMSPACVCRRAGYFDSTRIICPGVRHLRCSKEMNK